MNSANDTQQRTDALRAQADAIGSPFFFYDLDFLARHLAEVREALPPNVKIWYATKANPLSGVLREVRSAGFGVDVASAGELAQAVACGFAPRDIIATGPAKSPEYIRLLMERGVGTIVCESVNQLRWTAEAAAERGAEQQVLLRVQVEWERGADYMGGGEVTPFGLSPADWAREMPRELPKSVKIAGFHAFQWGNLLNERSLSEIWRRCAAELSALGAELNVRPAIIDIGGGLGVPYEDGADALDVKALGGTLGALADEFGVEQIWMELGRYLTASAGVYATRIIDRKTVRGRELLVTEGGINHIARPVLTGQSFPCYNAGNLGGQGRGLDKNSEGELRGQGRGLDKTTEFSVHGPLCTALDKLGTYQLPADTAVGDWLVFQQAGAYGMTESMPLFLCHDLPAEVIFKQGRTEVVRPPAAASDWVR